MRAARLPVIACRGFGNLNRQSRKPRIFHGSDTAISHIADVLPIKSYFNSNKSNGHTRNTRVVIIGRIGKLGNEKSEVAMREKTLERKLTEAVKEMGGIAPKFISPGFDGMPDRLVLLPDGKCGFVEVKRQGEEPRPLQESRHGMLRRLGYKVFVLDDAEQIGGVLREISAT